MIKAVIQKSSEVITGFLLGVLVVGFAGIVTANSTFSGPTNQPPNGFISPTFDGLTVNGKLDVEDTSGTSYIKGLTVRDFVVDNIQGCIGCSATQTIDVNSAYVDMRGVSNIELSSNQASNRVEVNAHMKARSIGYMYNVNTSKTLSNSYTGRLHSASVSCGSTNYLVSCTAYNYDYYMGYEFEGTQLSSDGRTCYGYAKQNESSVKDSTLYVEATCWDPDNRTNKNF